MRNRAALIFNSFFRCLCPCNPLSQTTLGTWQRARKNGSCACCQHRVKCTKLETTKPGKPSKSVAMHLNVSVDSTCMYEAVMVMQTLSMLFSMQDNGDTTKLREQETTYAKQKNARRSSVKQCELTSWLYECSPASRTNPEQLQPLVGWVRRWSAILHETDRHKKSVQ